MLIEDLIDKTLGYSNQQFIKEEILIPLGLKNTFGSLQEVDMDNVMSGYYVGTDQDFKFEDTGLMLATAEDVGIFIRSLNDGSVFKEGEQEIYSSVYVYNHTGLIPGYQSIAEYHEDIDTVVATLTSDFLTQGPKVKEFEEKFNSKNEKNLHIYICRFLKNRSISRGLASRWLITIIENKESKIDALQKLNY